MGKSTLNQKPCEWRFIGGRRGDISNKNGGNWRDLKAKMEFVQKPIMNHAPFTNFVIWSASKNILVPYSKKTGLVTLSLDYNSMWYSLHRGKKNRSAAVNPHRTSSSRGDLQSVRGLCNAYIITKGLKITRAF